MTWTHLHMFSVTRCAQAERMSQLLPSGAEASSDQVGADRILEEQRVGSVPSHLPNCPSVLFKAGVHIVWTGRDGVEGRSKRRRHGQAGWLCLRTTSNKELPHLLHRSLEKNEIL